MVSRKRKVNFFFITLELWYTALISPPYGKHVVDSAKIAFFLIEEFAEQLNYEEYYDVKPGIDCLV